MIPQLITLIESLVPALAGRIAPGERDEQTALPVAVYQFNGPRFERTMDGDREDFGRTEVTITIWHDDLPQAAGLAAEVVNAVDGYRAAPFLFITADMAGPETEPEKNTAGQAMVLTITHR